MTRYFFNFLGDFDKRDEEGMHFEDHASAKMHGMRCAAKLMREDPIALVHGKDLELQVTDDRGLVLFVLHVCVTDAPVVAPYARTEWV